MSHPQLNQILGKLRLHLEALYGERLASLILFGSQARKEASNDSDIDVLVVLNGTLDVPTERKRISRFLAELCLEYTVLVTCLWAEVSEWEVRQSPLMKNIRREGVSV